MKGRILMIAVAVLMMLAGAWAADVTGKWVATAPGGQGQGESTITLVLQAAGETLTGTLDNSAMPGAVAIEEGKIDGDTLSFSLKRVIGEQAMKVVWKGKVAGDEIRFTRGIDGGMGGPGGDEILAKRAK
jgi:hypothetical protein